MRNGYALLANLESLLLNLAADKLLHFGVAAPLRHCLISCLIEWGGRSCLGIRWKFFRVAWRKGSAVFTLHWAIGQVSKPRTMACHHPCDLCLHAGEGLWYSPNHVCRGVIIAVVPMNKTVKIGQVADIESLPCNLSSNEKRHLVMAAQLGCPLISGFVEGSKGTGCVFATSEMLTDLTSILVCHEAVGACLGGLMADHGDGSCRRIWRRALVNLEQSTAAGGLGSSITLFLLGTRMQRSESKQDKDELHLVSAALGSGSKGGT